MQALTALANNGSITFELGMDLYYVPHFVFDYLYGTNKTLIIKRDGYTFKINGKKVPESFLGHNQKLHGNLDGFIA